MVDKIDKLDPRHFRVQETPQDRERRHQQGQEEEEEKEKDKDEFGQGKPFWKKLIPETTVKAPLSMRPIWKGETGNREEVDSPPAEESGREVSMTLSRRVLILWGILDVDGRPRIPVIITYLAVVSVITVSTFLILGILWR